jgi:hypothetical protein
MLISSACAQTYDNAKINCFIRHIKKSKVLNTNFQELPTIREISDCNKIVDSALDVYLKKITESSILDLGPLNLENMLDKERKCFNAELKKRSVGDFILKLIIYRSLASVSFKLVIDQDKTRDHIFELIAASASYCTFNTVHDTFNNERIKNYCKRKYVLDNNILGLQDYNLTLNPFNVMIPSIQYEDLIEKIVKEESAFIEYRINTARSADEITNKYPFKFKKGEAIQFLSRNWAVIFLTEMNISAEEKVEKERQYAQDLFEFHKTKSIIPLQSQCCEYVRI